MSSTTNAAYNLFSVSIAISPDTQTVKLDKTTDYTISVTLDYVGDTLGNNKASCYLDGSWFKDLDEGQSATKKVTVSSPNIPTQKTYTHSVVCYHTYWGTQKSATASDSARIIYEAYPLALSFSVNPQSVSLDSCMKSETVVATVRNTGEKTITCQYQAYDGSWQSLGSVYSGGSAQSLPIKIGADVARSRNTFPIEISCTDQFGNTGTDTASVTINYVVHPADAAIEESRNALNDAKNQISEAEQEIQKASGLGADITSASGYLQKAKSYLSSAETDYNTALSSYQSTDCDSALRQAQSSKSTAQQIKNDASAAYNAANEAVRILEQKKQEASNSIASADAKISEAQRFIDEGDALVGETKDILKNVLGDGKWDRSTNLGMEGIDSEANIVSAKSNLDNAKSYLSQANTAFNGKNYELTKQHAQKAVDSAESSKSLASQAQNRLYATVQRANVAYTEMSGAQTEIQNINKLYNVLSEIVRAAKKDTDLSSVEAEIANLKSVIDTSKDLYSQAQSEFSAGNYEKSVNLATQAKNKAAEPKNRIDRVMQSMQVLVKDTLDKKYAKAKSEIDVAKAKIKEASGTYAADGGEIVKAQSSLQNAEKGLKEAESLISKAKSSTQFDEFTSTASNSFSKLGEVETNTNFVKSHSQNAVNMAYATLGVGTAAVVGTGGAGFLFWRRKKGKGKKEEKTVEKEVKREKVSVSIMPRTVNKVEPVKEVKETIPVVKEKAEKVPIEEKEVIECPKCGIVKDDGKFCQECGSPLKKKTVVEKKKPKDTCPVCEAKITLDDKFCMNCGTKLKED